MNAAPDPGRAAPAVSAAPAARGAPGRVVEVHGQTRRGLLVATALTVAAGGAVAAGVTRTGWWLPLHLFVVGGLLSAISAATQMLAVTWSAAPAPPRAAAVTQRWAVAVGAVALVVGRETDRTWLLVAGGATVVLAMLALGRILWWIRRRAVTDRFAPAIEAYVTAILAGATGMTFGIVLGAGRAGQHHLGLRGAHLTVNVFGLVGLVIAGTLPYFAATQARRKLSPRATPITMRSTFVVLAAATGVSAAGHLVGRAGIVAGGMIAYALGLLAIATMLPIYSRKSLRWAGARLVQLATGIVWWLAMTVALAFAAIRETVDRPILHALVIGGFAQILVASLAYFGPVLRGGGHRCLAAGFATTRSWVSVAAGNAAALAALLEHGTAVAVASAMWLVDLTIRAARLLTAADDDARTSPVSR